MNEGTDKQTFENTDGKRSDHRGVIIEWGKLENHKVSHIWKLKFTSNVRKECVHWSTRALEYWFFYFVNKDKFIPKHLYKGHKFHGQASKIYVITRFVQLETIEYVFKLLKMFTLWHMRKVLSPVYIVYGSDRGKLYIHIKIMCTWRYSGFILIDYKK